MMHEPFTIELRGETITLTDDEAGAIRTTLLAQSLARIKTEQAAAREAGQVWYAIAWHNGTRDEEECFSLLEAAEALDGIDESGRGYSDSIRCPDGTIYTRDHTQGDDWVTLPVLTNNQETTS